MSVAEKGDYDKRRDGKPEKSGIRLAGPFGLLDFPVPKFH